MKKSQIPVLSIGLATLLCWGTQPLYAQRGNVLENIGRTLLDEALNQGNSRPPTTTPPQPKAQQSQIPSESGKTPSNNPYGGQWGNLIQPQPSVTPQPRIQPQPFHPPSRNPHAYPPISSRVDAYYYGPPPRLRPSQNPYQGNNFQPKPSTQTPRIYAPPSNAGPIKLVFPKKQQGTCEFSLVSGSSEFPRTMNPGEMQQLDSKSTWMVRIKENGTSKTYRLSQGTEYVFLRVGNSLELLMRLKPAIEIQPSTPTTP